MPLEAPENTGKSSGVPEKFLDPLGILAMTADLSAGCHVLHVDMDAFFAMAAGIAGWCCRRRTRPAGSACTPGCR